MDPEADRPERLWPRLWRGIGVLLLAFVFYVLSAGPANRLLMQGKLSPDLVERAYQPLVSITEAAGLDDLLLRYLDWWQPPIEQMGTPLPAQLDP